MGRLLASLALVAMVAVGCGGGSRDASEPRRGGGMFGFLGFGKDRNEVIVEPGSAEDLRPVIEQVVSLKADPAPGGVIVSTVGLPPSQGWWEADLVRKPSETAGVLVLEFRINPPKTTYPAGTQPSREVLGGTFLTTQDLAGIRTIVVEGRTNRRSVRRR